MTLAGLALRESAFAPLAYLELCIPRLLTSLILVIHILIYFYTVCRCNSINICIGSTIPNPTGIDQIATVEDPTTLRICLNSYDEDILVSILTNLYSHVK